ncbi:MAG: hypothetical protein ACFFG0_12260 [Candidatus Thorarchaeota archaeon]
MGEKERKNWLPNNWDCIIDHIDLTIDKIKGIEEDKVDFLREQNKSLRNTIEMSDTYLECIDKVISEVFRLRDIRAWLFQKQVYYGWNHNYNIKNPDEMINNEDLGFLIEMASIGINETIVWEEYNKRLINIIKKYNIDICGLSLPYYIFDAI